MACRTVVTGPGVTAIFCDRSRRDRKCSSCGTYGADKACDYPTKTKSDTCDRALCSRCAVSVGPDRDYCPAHHRLSQETKTL
jgi:hypothetical protein